MMMKLFKTKLCFDGEVPDFSLGAELKVKKGYILYLETEKGEYSINDHLHIVDLLRDSYTPCPYSFKVYLLGGAYWVKVSISRDYLEKVCRQTWLLPSIIQSLFSPQQKSELSVEENSIKPAGVHVNFNNIQDTILYPYQKGNIAWMLEIENAVSTGNNAIGYTLKDHIYELKTRHLHYYLDRKNSVMYSREGLLQCEAHKTYRYKGGVLCDEVGLGKTLSMIRLIENSPRKKTLILCPRRLVNQWMSEFKKYNSPVKCTELSTMIHVNKFKPAEAQVVIVSMSLMENKSYYTNENRVLNAIEWDRLIIDEGHEILRYSTKENPMLNDIFRLKTRYKWICSGTPMAYGEDSLTSMLALLGDELNIRPLPLLENIGATDYTYIIDNLFHRNTRDSIQNQIYIPKVEYHVDLLTFSPTEMAMYQATPDNQKLQICSNITITDRESEILGNGVILSLDQINKAMGTHYKSLCEELITTISETEKRIVQLTQEQIERVDLAMHDIAQAFDPEEIKLLRADKNKLVASYRNRLKTLKENLEKYKGQLVERQKQLQKFRSLDLTYRRYNQCPILGIPLTATDTAITTEGCYYSRTGIDLLFSGGRKDIQCPCTGEIIRYNEILYVNPVESSELADADIGAWGTKIAHIIKQLRLINTDEKIIIFSRYNKMLSLIARVLEKVNLKYVFCQGNVHVMTNSINRFKNDPLVKIILLSSENCSSGCNLTEASHIFLLDTVSPDKVASLAINEQAVGRAARLGQKNTVHVYNFIIRDTIEETYYNAMINP